MWSKFKNRKENVLVFSWVEATPVFMKSVKHGWTHSTDRFLNIFISTPCVQINEKKNTGPQVTVFLHS